MLAKHIDCPTSCISFPNSFPLQGRARSLASCTASYIPWRSGGEKQQQKGRRQGMRAGRECCYQWEVMTMQWAV